MNQCYKHLQLVSFALVLFVFSFLQSILVFGPDDFIKILYSNNTLKDDVHFKVSTELFSYIFWCYNIFLIALFFLKPESRESYISLMKRFKIYKGDYHISHVNTFSWLSIIILIIISMSQLSGIIYFILEGKYTMKDIPFYHTFSVGFLCNLAFTTIILSSLGLVWINEHIDQLLPEHNEE